MARPSSFIFSRPKSVRSSSTRSISPCLDRTPILSYICFRWVSTVFFEMKHVSQMYATLRPLANSANISLSRPLRPNRAASRSNDAARASTYSQAMIGRCTCAPRLRRMTTARRAAPRHRSLLLGRVGRPPRTPRPADGYPPLWPPPARRPSWGSPPPTAQNARAGRIELRGRAAVRDL